MCGTNFKWLIYRMICCLKNVRLMNAKIETFFVMAKCLIEKCS